jgi:hypothetical protein
VTDNSPWQRPGSQPPGQDAPAFPPPAPASAPGRQLPGQQPWAPQGGRPPYGGAAPYGGRPPHGAPAGWAPPPKPGLVPLRPLGFGTLLGASFQVLRRNPKASFGSALLTQGLITVTTLVIVGAVTYFALSRIESAAPEEQDAVLVGGVAAIIASALASVILSVAAGALLQGIIVLEVARGTLGEKLTLGSLWRLAWRRLWPLVLWSLLYSVAVLVAVGIIALVVVLLVSQGDAFIALGVLFGLLGGLGLAVAFVWLFTKLSLTPSVIVLERRGVFAAMARSWRLTGGYFWRVFGVQALVVVIVQVATQIVTTPIGIVFGILMGLLYPNGTVPADDLSAQSFLPVIGLYGVTLLVTLVFAAIGAVAQSASSALVYIDLRMRKEGLDIELARFVETRRVRATGAAGDDEAPDPYLTVPAGAAAGPRPGAPGPWA